jgi:hypothetical protein
MHICSNLALSSNVSRCGAARLGSAVITCFGACLGGIGRRGADGARLATAAGCAMQGFARPWTAVEPLPNALPHRSHRDRASRSAPYDAGGAAPSEIEIGADAPERSKYMTAGLSPRAVITHQTDEVSRGGARNRSGAISESASEPSSWTSLCRSDRSLSSTNRGSASDLLDHRGERGRWPEPQSAFGRYSGTLSFLAHGLW